MEDSRLPATALSLVKTEVAAFEASAVESTPEPMAENQNCQSCQAERGRNKVWSRQLEFMISGPFQCSGGEAGYFLTLCDTYSKWILAKVSKTEDDSVLILDSAKFVFNALCQFGFTSVVMVGANESFHKLFMKQFSILWNSLDVTLSIPLNRLIVCQNDSVLGDDLKAEIVDFVADNSNTWEDLLDAWLFKKRTSFNANQVTPFSLMFVGRQPFSDNLDATEREQVSSDGSDQDDQYLLPRRRHLKSTRLRCRHCDEEFTSTSSFTLHQQRHLEEAKSRGKRFGERQVKSKDGDQPDLDVVSKIKKGKRAPKRTRISAKQPSSIIEDPTKLKIVTDSVRLLLGETKEERGKRGKYIKINPQLRDEIADYALTTGNMAAANHYSKLLGHPVAESTVRNFVKAADRHFNPALKLEIGRHAYQFGYEACAKMYANKVPAGVTLDKFTLHKLLRLFLSKNPDLPILESDADDQEEAADNVDNANATTRQKFVFESELRDEIGSYAHHCGNINAVHHFSSRLRFPMKECTVRKFKKVWMEKNGIAVLETDLSMSIDNSISVDLPLSLTKNEASASSKQEVKTRTNRKRKSKVNLPFRRYRRGQYASYDPELRGDIARYASEHSNHETVVHFKEKLGIDLPESTVRGLREKYFVKQADGGNQDKIVELKHDKRGRPMTLGNYDSTVRKCILDLVASGEKPTPFMVIATAKEVLMQHDPSMLPEYGGSIQLNPTWAKSFLKRLNLN